jgi:formylglycine-generating enzyme required for sulfatase activity
VQDTVGASKAETKTKVFISYSRRDIAFADKLEESLKSRTFEVLIDREEIYAFEDWWKRIETLIAGADTIVFVLSPDSVSSEVALKEVAFAASLNKRFAPIVCRRVEDNAVPQDLRRLNFIFFDEPMKFEASADRLAAALQTDIAWIRRHTEFGEAARRWTEDGSAGGLLLRPPVLDQAEAWMAFRPNGAPPPTAETKTFIEASRKAEVATKRRSRILNTALYTMLVGIIVGLLGWMNQATIAEGWRFVTVTWPYALQYVRPYVLNAAKEQSLKPGQSFKECGQDCPEMIVLPAGSFMMGAPPSQSQAQGYANEIPQHVVRFAWQFAVAKYPLTFADWDTCVKGGGCNGHSPSDQGWGRGRYPVINVSWDDAQQYVAWLSRVTGKAYRLLSEAEYEYATRAGTTTIYPWGDAIGKDNADCYDCGSKWDGKQTAPVGSFPPNKFGLYDMVGNVWEWTEDCIHSDYDGAPTDGSAWLTGDCSDRVTRAGSWGFGPGGLRSADRSGWAGVDQRTGALGFRIARTLVGP